MSASERYVVADVGSGAILLDLLSGNISMLNGSGAFVWRSWIDGRSAEQIAHEMAVHYRLDRDRALEDVHRMLRAPIGDVPKPPPTDFDYRHIEGKYTFAVRGEVVLLVDERGDRVTRCGSYPTEVLVRYLHALAPKVLTLRGHTVVHAAGVRCGDAVLAFAGVSGAGKTTTARACAQAQAKVVADDQLPVVASGSDVRAFVEGERLISEWISQTAETLGQSLDASCAELDAVSSGQALPLVEIGFVDLARRTKGSYAARSMSPMETAGSLLRNMFFGSDAPLQWIRTLRAAVRIGQSAAGFELSLPDGLQRLQVTASTIGAAGTFRS